MINNIIGKGVILLNNDKNLIIEYKSNATGLGRWFIIYGKNSKSFLSLMSFFKGLENFCDDNEFSKVIYRENRTEKVFELGNSSIDELFRMVMVSRLFGIVKTI